MSSVVAPGTSTKNFSLSSLFGVQGRLALVTGGGSGLGAVTAATLALHGAKVYIVGRRKEKLDEVIEDFEKRKKDTDAPNEAARGAICAIQGDVASKDNIAKVVEAFRKQEQHLDILVNGAGIMCSPESKPDKDDGHAVIKALWEEDWNNFSQTFDLNLFGLHYTTAAFAPLLAKAQQPSLEHPGAVVLNIASISGIQISRGSSISYQTSKSAVMQLSSIMAGRLIPLKIRVNCICPGIFPSPMTLASTAADYNNPQHHLHNSIKAGPLQRSGTPEDFAGLMLFLSSRAGAYMNSAQIVIDGGRVITLSAA